MTDFVLIPSEYDEVPRFLTNEVPSFVESEEYKQLQGQCFDLPGVVFAAFRKYFFRLQASAGAKTDFKINPELGACYRAIEKMANSQDHYVMNLVMDEIFQNLDCNKTIGEAIRNQLLPASRALYDKWIR
jgi:hypothetical protein